MTVVVRANGVGKQYRAYVVDRPRTLQQAIQTGFRNVFGVARFWSLQDVTFSLERGRALGVVGRNGAGKSTLLRIVGGVMRPDRGTIEVRGRVGGLLELTAGFHPDLTGRENVFVGGVIRGLTRAEVAARFADIVEFAELEHAIDRPIRTYSGGMQMRLAFSVATASAPELLLVDEVLAVGDAAFQKKCLERIAHLRDKGSALVLVSHDASVVRDLCDEALWLHEGKVAGYGAAGKVVDDYANAIRRATLERTSPGGTWAKTSQGVVLVPGVNRFGSREVSIDDVRIVTSSGSASELDDGDSVAVELDYAIHSPVPGSPIFCVAVVAGDGSLRADATTEQVGFTLPEDATAGCVTARLRNLALEPGVYFAEVGVYERRWAFAYDQHVRAYPLIVRGSGRLRSEQGGARTEWTHEASRTAPARAVVRP